MKKIEFELQSDRIVKIIDGLESASTNYDKISDLVAYLNEQAESVYKAGVELENILASAKKTATYLEI